MLPHTAIYKDTGFGLEVASDAPLLLKAVNRYFDLSNKKDAPKRSTLAISLKIFNQAANVPSLKRKKSNFPNGYISIKKREIYSWLPDPINTLVGFDLIPFFHLPLYTLMSFLKYYYMHGSLLTKKDGTTIIFSGQGGCGKSTLAAILSMHGFKFLCDDILFLKKVKDRYKLITMPTRPKMDYMKHKDILQNTMPRPQPAGNIEISQENIICIFPHYTKGTKPYLEPIPQRQGLSRLLIENMFTKSGNFDKKTGMQDKLDFFHHLSQKTKFYQLGYNDKNLATIASLL